MIDTLTVPHFLLSAAAFADSRKPIAFAGFGIAASDRRRAFMRVVSTKSLAAARPQPVSSRRSLIASCELSSSL
jgi:hypothetical protein